MIGCDNIMLVDLFYRFRFSYDKHGKVYLLNNKINTLLANAFLPILLNGKPIKRGIKVSDIVVSLTTYPPRIRQAAWCIDSLLRQTVSPGKIILWLAKSDYSSLDSVPFCIKKYMEDGLEIRFCDDIKSYKKIIYTAREFSDYRIVTADDDFFYPSTWLEELNDAQKEAPNTIVCHRAHQIYEKDGKIETYNKWNWYSNGIQGPSHSLHILTGAGTIFPPNFFQSDFFDLNTIMKYAPTTDDMWVKVYALRHNVKVMKVKPVSKSWITVGGSQCVSLISINQTDGNSYAIQKLLEIYGIDIHEILCSEYNESTVV